MSKLGSGCGSVGRAVTFNSRGPRCESSHWQKIILNIYCQLYWKDENKEKEAWNGPFKDNNFVSKTLTLCRVFQLRRFSYFIAAAAVDRKWDIGNLYKKKERKTAQRVIVQTVSHTLASHTFVGLTLAKHSFVSWTFTAFLLIQVTVFVHRLQVNLSSGN